MIAATVASDPEKYSEAILGKPNEDYCAWIMNPEKWGGLLLAISVFQSYTDYCLAAYWLCTENRLNSILQKLLVSCMHIAFLIFLLRGSVRFLGLQETIRFYSPLVPVVLYTGKTFYALKSIFILLI